MSLHKELIILSVPYVGLLPLGALEQPVRAVCAHVPDRTVNVVLSVLLVEDGAVAAVVLLVAGVAGHVFGVEHAILEVKLGVAVWSCHHDRRGVCVDVDQVLILAHLQALVEGRLGLLPDICMAPASLKEEAADLVPLASVFPSFLLPFLCVF